MGIARKTISVAGDKYDPDDGRMIRIVGENNQYQIKEFDASHLHKSYDIRFENSSGLPELKSAKIQRALDALQRHPDLLPSARWEQILELGDQQKAINMIAAATQCADSENEDLLAGRPVKQPDEWEDHIAHWEAHVNRMQTRSFKEDVPPERQAAFRDHLFNTEVLMIDKAKANPEFEAKLATLVNFPIFPHVDFAPARSLEHQTAIVQGQANKEGMEVPGNQIPANISEER
jgi:hypothetical protein